MVNFLPAVSKAASVFRHKDIDRYSVVGFPRPTAKCVRDNDQGAVSVTSSIDSRHKYIIYTNMKRHNKLIADLLRSGLRELDT
jgi:hypothetical protein